VKTGVQKIRKALKELDSGFRRNDNMKKNQINFFTASGERRGILRIFKRLNYHAFLVSGVMGTLPVKGFL
jgi:hypothetical protein